MQIKDLFEQTPAPVTSTGQQAAGTQGDTTDQEVGKLTATINSLQKQVADLQKASLQQSTIQQQQAQDQEKPGEASQQQQATGTVGTGKGDGQVSPGAAPAAGDGNMLDMIKKLAGVDKTPTTAQQAVAAPAQKPQAPGVNQPPQITNLKIKQDLAKSQGKST